jgi:hypothetical protein
VGDFDRISSFVRLCSWGTRATQKAVITRKGAGPISLPLLDDNCRRGNMAANSRIFFVLARLTSTDAH